MNIFKSIILESNCNQLQLQLQPLLHYLHNID